MMNVNSDNFCLGSLFFKPRTLQKMDFIFEHLLLSFALCLYYAGPNQDGNSERTRSCSLIAFGDCLKSSC